jgi:acyl-CoA dehydrogenase
MAAVDVLILLITVLSLVYIQAPVVLWTLTTGLVLLLITLFSSAGSIALIIFWGLFLAATLFATLATLRRKYFTTPFVNLLQKRMPTISDTEREAIEAGNVWWEKDLFCGRPQWKKFLSMPSPKLSKEEQEFIDTQVETVCGMINDWDIVNKDRDLPKAVWDYLKQEKFFGLVIPKEYGGRGFSALAHSTVVLKIATRSISAAVNTMVPNSLGPGELVLHYGTSQQKEYYLPRLARGEEIPCFALTAPEAGSDAGAITDSGVVCYGQYNGKEVLGIRLNWDKRYITLAPVATVLGLAIRLYDPSRLLGEKDDIGITLCLIPTSHPGVETGSRHLPLHLAFMNGPTRGKDVFIPIDWIIGGVAMAGQGWRMLMECLSIGRSVSLPALSTACGMLTYRMTGAYARIRKQFNTPLASFEGIEEVLGDIAGMTYLLESCRQLTCSALDQKVRPSIVSAIAKYHMTEMARKVMSHAMDVHAGHMIQVGPRNFLAHGYFAVPISITVEGANILTRNLIIFGQGAIRCHPYLIHEVELFSTPDSPQKIKQMDKLLLSHIGYALSNFVRSFISGLTCGKLLRSPTRDSTAGYYRQLTRMSIALSLLSDVCMLVLGGNLKRKERTSARLGDMLSELYLASAVLKYFNDQGKPASDLDYIKWCVQMCLHRIQVACDDLLNNFPIRWLGKLFRWIIFPYGTAYQKPRDSLYHKIVAQMISPSAIRERITQYCFIDKSPEDSMRRIEELLAQVDVIEPTLKKYQKAVRSGHLQQVNNNKERVNAALNAGVLTDVEARSLHEFYELYEEVIKVDEFSFDLSRVLV